jgi:hypothetical protein
VAWWPEAVTSECHLHSGAESAGAAAADLGPPTRGARCRGHHAHAAAGVPAGLHRESGVLQEAGLLSPGCRKPGPGKGPIIV